MLDIPTLLRGGAEDAEGFLSETVEQAVREHLTGGEIVSVDSIRGHDFSGESVITVTIVVNAKPSDFEPQRLASLIGKLRSALAAIHEHAFPMVSFMSPTEREARMR